MPKVVIDDRGLVQKAGGGVEINNALHVSDELKAGAALYSANGTVTAAATNGTQLDSALIQTVTAGVHDHRVQMPLAKGPGQVMILRNVGATYRVDIRNNANDADILNPFQAGKTAICYSTASGDNWVGSEID